MKNTILPIFARCAALLLMAGLTPMAGSAKAEISTITTPFSFQSGDLFQLSFNGTLSLTPGYNTEEAWTIQSQPYDPGFGDFMMYFPGHPARISVASGGWYTYSTGNGNFNAGDLIGSFTNFNNDPYVDTSFASRYFALSFNTEPSLGAGGGILYGWLRLSYDSSTGAGQLLAAAINTTPDQSIVVGNVGAIPEPSTYALFGIGAAGILMVMRRKKTA